MGDVINWDMLSVLQRHRRHGLVLTNGCFDLIHRGHVEYLREAKRLGHTLIVGLNSDRAVALLKGPRRPVCNESDRAYVLCALSMVDFVCIVDDIKMVEFIYRVQPSVWVKGGDYTVESLDVDEVKAARAVGAEIKILPMVPGVSTTATLARLAS